MFRNLRPIRPLNIVHETTLSGVVLVKTMHVNQNILRKAQRTLLFSVFVSKRDAYGVNIILKFNVGMRP